MTTRINLDSGEEKSKWFLTDKITSKKGVDGNIRLAGLFGRSIEIELNIKGNKTTKCVNAGSLIDFLNTQTTNETDKLSKGGIFSRKTESTDKDIVNIFNAYIKTKEFLSKDRVNKKSASSHPSSPTTPINSLSEFQKKIIHLEEGVNTLGFAIQSLKELSNSKQLNQKAVKTQTEALNQLLESYNELKPNVPAEVQQKLDQLRVSLGEAGSSLDQLQISLTSHTPNGLHGSTSSTSSTYSAEDLKKFQEEFGDDKEIIYLVLNSARNNWELAKSLLDDLETKCKENGLPESVLNSVTQRVMSVKPSLEAEQATVDNSDMDVKQKLPEARLGYNNETRAFIRHLVNKKRKDNPNDSLNELLSNVQNDFVEKAKDRPIPPGYLNDIKRIVEELQCECNFDNENEARTYIEKHLDKRQVAFPEETIETSINAVLADFLGAGGAGSALPPSQVMSVIKLTQELSKEKVQSVDYSSLSDLDLEEIESIRATFDDIKRMHLSGILEALKSHGHTEENITTVLVENGYGRKWVDQAFSNLTPDLSSETFATESVNAKPVKRGYTPPPGSHTPVGLSEAIRSQGFDNLSCTCYMNSGLQLVRAMGLSEDVFKGENCKISTELNDLLSRVSSENSSLDNGTMRGFFNSVVKNDWRWGATHSGRQEDVNEFLEWLIPGNKDAALSPLTFPATEGIEKGWIASSGMAADQLAVTQKIEKVKAWMKVEDWTEDDHLKKMMSYCPRYAGGSKDNHLPIFFQKKIKECRNKEKNINQIIEEISAAVADIATNSELDAPNTEQMQSYMTAMLRIAMSETEEDRGKVIVDDLVPSMFIAEGQKKLTKNFFKTDGKYNFERENVVGYKTLSAQELVDSSFENHKITVDSSSKFFMVGVGREVPGDGTNPALKSHTEVSFTENIKVNGVTYQPRAVALHEGQTMNSGHYTALVRDENDSKTWNFHNDSTVQRTTNPDQIAFREKVTTILYERVEDSLENKASTPIFTASQGVGGKRQPASSDPGSQPVSPQTKSTANTAAASKFRSELSDRIDAVDQVLKHISDNPQNWAIAEEMLKNLQQEYTNLEIPKPQAIYELEVRVGDWKGSLDHTTSVSPTLSGTKEKDPETEALRDAFLLARDPTSVLGQHYASNEVETRKKM
ncbi:hypothetical protein SCG7086_BC_00030 [Chlamydiales bacterium SCGC AG-110-P3]|nr:hypothetical protein SCG7086_BC_00030 [Chlamydiales bacterium SCGC AG-110-P3]